MFVLALDTTTRRGSVALVRDGHVLDVHAGDPNVTHGQRLPSDVMMLLERNHLAARDIDLFAVASGPGSFTGLRIGIATMQGFALANARDIVGISALDALHHSVRTHNSSLIPRNSSGEAGSIELATWMDAQRGEVFSALYRDGLVVDGPSVEKPAAILARWAEANGGGPARIGFAGEGAVAYADLITASLPSATIFGEVPALAPSIALLALERSAKEGSAPPDAIRPLYIRRPDAELARDRKAGH